MKPQFYPNIPKVLTVSQFYSCKLALAYVLQGSFLLYYHSFSLCSQALALLVLPAQQESLGSMALVIDP